jgi:hypothetical protein
MLATTVEVRLGILLKCGSTIVTTAIRVLRLTYPRPSRFMPATYVTDIRKIEGEWQIFRHQRVTRGFTLD